MLRQLQTTDINEVSELNQVALGYDYPTEKMAIQLENLLNQPENHYLLGFEDEETKKIVGYIHAEVNETLYSGTLFNVLALAVFKEYSRRGIGQQLIAQVEEEAKNRHYEGVKLNSSLRREEAHKFYEAIGYNHDKTQKHFVKLDK